MLTLTTQGPLLFSQVLLSPGVLDWWQHPLSAHSCGPVASEDKKQSKAPRHSAGSLPAAPSRQLPSPVPSDLQRACIYKYAFIERRRKRFSFLHTQLTQNYALSQAVSPQVLNGQVQSFSPSTWALPSLGSGSRRKRRVYLSGGATSDGRSAKRPLSNLAIVFKGGQP